MNEHEMPPAAAIAVESAPEEKIDSPENFEYSAHRRKVVELLVGKPFDQIDEADWNETVAPFINEIAEEARAMSEYQALEDEDERTLFVNEHITRSFYKLMSEDEYRNAALEIKNQEKKVEQAAIETSPYARQF